MKLQAKLSKVANVGFQTTGIGSTPVYGGKGEGIPISIDLTQNPESWLDKKKDGIYKLDINDSSYPELKTLFIAKAGQYTAVALDLHEVKSDLGIRDRSVILDPTPVVVITDKVKACLSKIIPTLTP